MVEDNKNPIKIIWEGPIPVDEALREYNKDEDYGLYQIYGRHIVYGSDVLLYIGIAKDQPFSKRISQHDKKWLGHINEEKIELRLGRIEHKRKDKHWREQLQSAEKLTIYWHSPAYNSQHIQTYHSEDIKIQNWGKRGDLDFEYSGTWERPKPIDDVK